jgi:hypothetical protein
VAVSFRWGHSVSLFRPKLVLESDIGADQSTREYYSKEPTGSFRSRRRKFARELAAERRERDTERGYSINVKQVVLAFAVEFWIIALIIVGTYLLIAESGQLSREAIFSALLFPAALSMVELARVPLAIAVRTQNAWHIKFLASLGVIAAITVTSFSLSQIAWKTFDNRIVEATLANDKLIEAKKNLLVFQNVIDRSQSDIAQKNQVRNNVSERLAGLEAQLTKISSASGLVTTPLRGPDGKLLLDETGKTQTSSHLQSIVNPTQLNVLKGQIASTKKELEAAQADVQKAEQYAKTIDLKDINTEVAQAEATYRAAVNKSQLHSYTAMVTGKAVADVTDAEVKNLEKYLIIIPSIAAALASTLIAITSVRRIKPDPQSVSTLPDDAAAYLFGPLVEAIKTAARDTVMATINNQAKATPPPETAKA